MVEYVGNVYVEADAEAEAFACPYRGGNGGSGGCAFTPCVPNVVPCVLF